MVLGEGHSWKLSRMRAQKGSSKLAQSCCSWTLKMPAQVLVPGQTTLRKGCCPPCMSGTLKGQAGAAAPTRQRSRRCLCMSGRLLVETGP